MTESAPTDPLPDTDLASDRLYIFPQNRWSSVWSATTVVAFAKTQSPGSRYQHFSFHSQSVSQRPNRGARVSAKTQFLHGPTTPQTMERVTLIVLSSKSTSSYLRPNNSFCRRRVEAASSTSVRSLSASRFKSSLISTGVSTIGGVLRLAPWRTRLTRINLKRPPRTVLMSCEECDTRFM